MPGHYGKKLPTKHAGVKRGTDLGSSMQPSTEVRAPSVKEGSQMPRSTERVLNRTRKLDQSVSASFNKAGFSNTPGIAEEMKKRSLKRRSQANKRKK